MNRCNTEQMMMRVDRYSRRSRKLVAVRTLRNGTPTSSNSSSSGSLPSLESLTGEAQILTEDEVLLKLESMLSSNESLQTTERRSAKPGHRRVKNCFFGGVQTLSELSREEALSTGDALIAN